MKQVKIGDRDLTREEIEQIYISLSVRLGFIETGTINRAKDLQKADSKFVPKIFDKGQMKLIVMLEEMMDELL